MTTDLFRCPICRGALRVNEKSYICEKNHTFDIARQGYVNLLRAGAPHTQHGDNREMLLARRRFLAAGYYRPLMDAVKDTAVHLTHPGGAVLDAGCGECSYTAAVEEELRASGTPATVLGVDISREALAIGKNPHLALAVASLYHLPIGDASLDLLLEIFSPHCGEEYRRVLRPGGHLIMAIPGARHLLGLKEALYATPYENAVQDTALPGFLLQEKQDITATITLHGEEIHDLFAMTPYYYRTSPVAKETLLSRTELSTEIAFHLFVYKKE